MNKKILILTQKKIESNHRIVAIQVKNLTKDTQLECILSDKMKKDFQFVLCIIDLQASVQKMLKLVEMIKKNYAFPICVFEKDIKEKYQGERLKLDRRIDILIRSSLNKNDFFSLFWNILGISEYKRYNPIEQANILQDNSRNILIYPQKRMLFINRNKINLTRKEFDIFIYLFQKEGAVVSHKELYEMVWKREYLHDDTNIMAHIHRLRGKVEEDPKKPKYICNQYGVGYYFGGLFQETLPTL